MPGIVVRPNRQQLQPGGTADCSLYMYRVHFSEGKFNPPPGKKSQNGVCWEASLFNLTESYWRRQTTDLSALTASPCTHSLLKLKQRDPKTTGRPSSQEVAIHGYGDPMPMVCIGEAPGRLMNYNSSITSNSISSGSHSEACLGTCTGLPNTQ